MTRFGILVAVSVTSSVAFADSVLDGGLVATSCEVDVAFAGGIANGELRVRFKNPSPEEASGSYAFELPRGAVVTAFSARGVAATRVGKTFSTEQRTSKDVLDVDPALLEKVGGGYRAVIAAVEPEKDVAIATRWSAPAEIVDGALRVAIPGRAAADTGLVDCKLSVRAVPGPGATVTKVVAPATVGATDAIVDVQLAFARPEPVVWTQTESLGGKAAATVVSVLAPPAKATTQHATRAIFVIDTSRSMELVGRANAIRVMRAVAAALPANAQVEAVTFDRTADRAFGGWRPATAANVDAIAAAVTKRPVLNGTDLVGAFGVVHAALGEVGRDETLVIAITDGMLGEGRELAVALDARAESVDVHVIALDPAGTSVPSASRLRRPIDQLGGSYVELVVDDLDRALPGAANWLRPSWTEVALSGARVEVAPQLRAGSGSVSVVLHDGPLPPTTLRAKALAPVTVTARAIAGGGVAALARPVLTDASVLAVLSDRGRVAANRAAMVRGGGPYTRVAAGADVVMSRELAAPVPVASGTRPSAIAPIALERMLREQLQPGAFACYQRALGIDATIAGTVQFTVHIARGEVTHAEATGIGDAAFGACLVTAAYGMTAPIPDLRTQDDDETIVRYPLSFSVREHKATIMPGDADSDTAIDIDAVEGGVPGQRKPVKVDATTPLGPMRP